MRLGGKTAIITGGAGSLGSAQTRLFVEQGARVVFGDVAAEDGRALEAEITAAGGEASFVHADITAAEGWAGRLRTKGRTSEGISRDSDRRSIYGHGRDPR
jgi:2,5-dichloro-2,5-cyclohexadiene-1,4-diol dehydrogenase 2